MSGTQFMNVVSVGVTTSSIRETEMRAPLQNPCYICMKIYQQKYTFVCIKVGTDPKTGLMNEHVSFMCN